MASLRGFIFGGLIFGVPALVVGILIGVAFMGGISYMLTGGVNVPYNMEHTEISKQFTIFDTTDGVALNVKHVFTGQASFHVFAPYDVFEPRETYTQSLWIWVTGESNDIEVTMTIWGPASDGQSYLVEFGKHAGNTVEIKGYGDSKIFASGTDQGYWGLIVTLP